MQEVETVENKNYSCIRWWVVLHFRMWEWMSLRQEVAETWSKTNFILMFFHVLDFERYGFAWEVHTKYIMPKKPTPAQDDYVRTRLQITPGSGNQRDWLLCAQMIPEHTEHQYVAAPVFTAVAVLYFFRTCIVGLL